jgi:hypothetical protein
MAVIMVRDIEGFLERRTIASATDTPCARSRGSRLAVIQRVRS